MTHIQLRSLLTLRLVAIITVQESNKRLRNSITAQLFVPPGVADSVGLDSRPSL